MSDKVKFWGVRGSIATPGPKTTTVGGNTSCIEVRLGNQRTILDGGTGLRALGAEESRPMRCTILFSHLHWDHIQGVPFFAPLYNPESEITLVGPDKLEEALRAQMSRPTFPVGMDAMGARIKFVTVTAGDEFTSGPVRISTCALNHPGGAIGYRLACNGRVVVYACDCEHSPDGPDPHLVELAAGTDLLIYDAQYLPAEYSSRRGWGHSTFEQGVMLAQRAGARRLALTHHEPARSDSEVARIEDCARRTFPESWAAREGMVFEFDPDRESLPVDRMLEAYLASSLASG